MRSKAKTVLAFGSFDIVHPGHLSYLEKARRLGSKLIVVVARDSTIRMLKKHEPVFRERERLRMIRALRFVDMAALGNRVKDRDGIYEILGRYKPDIIALGYDQRADVEKMKKYLCERGIRARIVRIGLNASEAKYKSSSLSAVSRPH
ncbi:MAG: adenylyltransferase/cytidyltransferase family protein [Candidatus Micrarchaeaceae archaeon]